MSRNYSYSGKIYLASDFHLGIEAKHSSSEREERIVRWLDTISLDANLIILVGDIFDYWFEYKQVVPRGFSKFWSKIRELRDKEVPIIFFTGNHDMWMFDYPTKEYGIPILRKPTEFILNGKRVLIHHGDGLGPGDHGYKFIKLFTNSKICQWLFARLHPNFAISVMRFFSGKNRKQAKEDTFDPSKERLVKFCEEQLKTEDYDYFIFGHRHLVIDHRLSNDKSRYINLGDWTHFYSYLEVNNENFKLKTYE